MTRKSSHINAFLFIVQLFRENVASTSTKSSIIDYCGFDFLQMNAPRGVHTKKLDFKIHISCMMFKFVFKIMDFVSLYVWCF